uniref:ATP synthase subunit a n=1 Tax=Brontostoma colossus TaxID=1532881 RepID=A0A076L4I3_9HEMI|nr:ATP synthase F0 subunit 6 [Brontostoma colossus]AIJ02995.1 ATP synthase F0 subunit 6 [Brontostoma colossus]
MMTNLFSTFDPASSMSMSLNWMSITLPLLLLPSSYWITKSRYMEMMKIIMNSLYKEFKMLLGTNSQGMPLMFISLFLMIMINNMMGLIPYIFTATSHLTMTLSISIPLWTTLMIFGWSNHTNNMLTHLIPEGSPLILTPFMACIEMTSNIIRPGSLAVRLAANMIAGHLLMSLLGNNMINTSNYMIPMMMTIQIMLMLFETAVSIIQAYVFSILGTLYTSEVN